MHDDDYSSAAVQFLIEGRFLAECEVHGYTKGGRRDLRDLWPVAISQFKLGRAGAVPWAVGMDQRTFTDVLQAAYNDNCGECIGCIQMEQE